MTRIISFIFVGLLLIYFLIPLPQVHLKQLYTKAEVSQWSAPPPLTIDVNQNYKVDLLTDRGKITFELQPSLAPQAVNNFIFLAQQKFYDKVRFYKIGHDFLIEAGDPWETGRGGAGYVLSTEPTNGEYRRGVVVVGNNGPDTNRSTFFIIHKDIDWPKHYTIIGTIREGDEKSFAVLDEIAKTSVFANEYGELTSASTPPVIDSVVISME